MVRGKERLLILRIRTQTQHSEPLHLAYSFEAFWMWTSKEARGQRMKGGKGRGAESCTFKSDLTNERLPKNLHILVMKDKGRSPWSQGRLLVAGKFATRKRRWQPRQAWIRSLPAGKDTELRKLPERPAEAPWRLCAVCHLFPWRHWGSGAAVASEKLLCAGLPAIQGRSRAAVPASLCPYVSGTCSMIRSHYCNYRLAT